MSEHESPNTLSSRTTPTWEVELLISGVAVFAMLQLPGWLDDGVFALIPRLDATLSTFVELLYYYAKSAALILAVSFVLHLLLRARWIALVGMHSVYPDGVRWDKLRMGPIQREIQQEYQVATEVVIERADNLATTVFSIGVMLAIILVVLTFGFGLVMGSAAWIATTADWPEGAFLIFFAVFALVMTPFLAVVTLDRRFGGRWKKESRMHRLVSGTLRGYARLGMHPGNNRTRALLASNGGDRRVGVLMALIMACTIAIVMFAYWSMRRDTQFGSYAWFPTNATSALDDAHYDDQRNPSRDRAVPYVQSMVVREPFVKLVIPYNPRADGPAMQLHCGPRSTVGDAELLACLQALHPLQLDGKPVEQLHYDVASDPRTDRPALVVMIDVRRLPAGRHELRVGRAPTPSDEENDNTAAEEQADEGYVIPFWR